MSYSKITIRLYQDNANLIPIVEIDIAFCKECIAMVLRYRGESHTQIVVLTDVEELRKQLT